MFQTLTALITFIVSSNGHYLFNPFYKLFRYNTYPSTSYYTRTNYANHVPIYNNRYVSQIHQYPATLQQYAEPQPQIIASYVHHPSFNVLAEVPYSIEKTFTVVPMIIVPEDSLNMVNNAHIVTMSKQKPTMVIKTDKNVMQCTPAVKIVLEQPIIVYNFKTPILFPSEMTIQHDNIKIPIRVGAVIAPIGPEVVVSEETPVTIQIVYAIPTKPVKMDNKVDYVNNEKDVVVDPEAQAVIVSNEPNEQNEQKVPVLNFPSAEAEPVVSENEDDELGKLILNSNESFYSLTLSRVY